MEISLLNSDFERIYILDDFISLIWTDRFWACGDFEIVVPPTLSIISKLESAQYLSIKESDHLMFLDDFNIHTDIEAGTSLTLTGRSLEAILDRRIVWTGTVLTGNFQTGIQTLLNDAIISPTDSDRDISNFEFQASTDPAITALTIDSQFIGDNLYNVIAELCDSKKIGFKITLTSSKNFRFELYAGKNRSYTQSTNPYVVFSMNFDNLLNSDYVESRRYFKSIALVAGEQGVGNTRLQVSVAAPGGSLTGLNRREIYLEPNVTRNTPGEELTDEEYMNQLESKGKEELAKYIYIKNFDGEIQTTTFKFGEDFYMGDIVQIADEYGHKTESRVIEMIYSEDKEGISKYPTFANVED